MKTTIALLMLFAVSLIAQPTNRPAKASPARQRELVGQFRSKVGRLSPADLAAIQRILDKYPNRPTTNAPAKPKAK